MSERYSTIQEQTQQLGIAGRTSRDAVGGSYQY